MQRHYRRLILLLIVLYCYMFRSYDHHQAENILIARVTQLTMDPLFYNIANIIIILYIIKYIVIIIIMKYNISNIIIYKYYKIYYNNYSNNKI
jgi:predicted membrane protein